VIKIGDFARLSQVSVVTLRYYDEMDLLKPVKVDSFTGYRFYSAEQLPLLNRILALKDLGFSLEQIRLMLADGLTLEQLRSMLTMQRNEVEKRLADERERLFRIEARLRQIELEDKMPKYDVVIKTVPAMLVAARRVTSPTNDQVPQYLGPAYTEVYNYIRKQGVKDDGQCMALWHSPADVYENEDAEAIVAIDHPLPGTDHVKVYELPQYVSPQLFIMVTLRNLLRVTLHCSSGLMRMVTKLLVLTAKSTLSMRKITSLIRSQKFSFRLKKCN
jgi:DNA-binding transcriptional MerR regulator